MLPEHIDRMKVEFDQLDERLDKLVHFIGFNPNFQSLEQIDKALLQVQQQAMQTYRSCLAQRLNAAGVEVDG